MMEQVMLASVLACAFAAAGCRLARPNLPIGPDPLDVVAQPASRPASKSRIVATLCEVVVADGPGATSVKGRPIRSWVYGKGERTVLILGGIHGDEPASPTLCEALRDHLAEHPDIVDGRRVVVVPSLNPDGLAAGTRVNARKVDLNRNFDTANRKARRRYGAKPLSEPESRFIADLIEQYAPAAIIAVHQPLVCVDYDGPAEELAAAMSRACGLPVKKLGASSGSLGSYAGVDLNIPIVTLELPQRVSRWGKAALWKHYGGAMIEAVRLTGVE
ncbi:MAG: murein peptide amidase A [Phycisphaerae bacterium]|nr:murein peptide amidase A [Phycisphaerae bacterium]